MTIIDVPVKVYQGNFQCAQRLSESLSVLSNVVPQIENCIVCNGKDYVNNDIFTDFHSSQHCIEMSYKCENSTDLGEKLMGQ